MYDLALPLPLLASRRLRPASTYRLPKAPLPIPGGRSLLESIRRVSCLKRRDYVHRSKCKTGPLRSPRLDQPIVSRGVCQRRYTRLRPRAVLHPPQALLCTPPPPELLLLSVQVGLFRLLLLQPIADLDSPL